MIVRFHKKCVIRTGLRAGFATDATPIVEIYDAVRARVKRGYGANFNTRRIGAMITAHHTEKSARVGKFAFFDVFYPRSINPDGNLMFRFTRDRAGVASDTLAVINDKTKVHINSYF